MKRVLFGLFALSTMLVANETPPATTNPGDGDTASVPVKVMAEIITAPAGLVITDEAGTVLDELLLDHGQIIKGMATDDATVQSVFKVRKYTNSAGTIGQVDLAGADKDILTVSLDKAGVATLYKGGDSNNKKDGENVIKSDLALKGGDTQTTTTEYSQILKASTTGQTDGDREHMGRITSTIPMGTLNGDALESGVYHNLGANKLTVTITP